MDTVVVYELYSLNSGPAFGEKGIILMDDRGTKWNVLESGKESSGVPQLSSCVRETRFLAFQAPLEGCLRGLSFQPRCNLSLVLSSSLSSKSQRMLPFCQHYKDPIYEHFKQDSFLNCSETIYFLIFFHISLISSNIVSSKPLHF